VLDRHRRAVLFRAGDARKKAAGARHLKRPD
jgi:hypothetical protein